MRFTFIRPNNVTVIADKRTLGETNSMYNLQHVQFYTMPFCESTTDTRIIRSLKNTNTIVGFSNDTLLDSVCSRLENEAEMQVQRIELPHGDFFHIAQLLNLPAVIITNASCELDNEDEFFDVFYKDFRRNKT